MATAQEFEDVRKRSRARTQAALRAQRAEAVSQNRQLLADLEAAEARADAALSGKSTAAVALRNAAKGVFVAAAELGPEIELQKRRERLEELEALKQRERDAVRKHNDEKLLAAEARISRRPCGPSAATSRSANWTRRGNEPPATPSGAPRRATTPRSRCRRSSAVVSRVNRWK